MNTLHPSVAAKEINHGRDEHQVFRHHDGGAHVNFQTGVLETSRGVQGEPGWIEGRATREVDGSAGGLEIPQCMAGREMYIFPSSQL